MGCSKNSSKKQVSNTTSPQETRKISNKQSNLIPKATRERRKKPKVSWRKEIIKIRAEINEIETMIKNLPTNKRPGPNGITGKLYQTFRGELTSILLKLFQKLQREEHSQTLYMRPRSP